MVAWTARWLAMAALVVGDYATAAALGEETLRIEGELGNSRGMTAVTWVIGLARLEQGQVESAAVVLRDGLMRVPEDFTDGPPHLGALGIAAARQGELLRATRLLGACDAACARGDQEPLPPPHLAYFQRYGERVRAALGDPDWTVAWEEGQAMTVRQAVEYALAEDRCPGA
jgi:hypothetical protein